MKRASLMMKVFFLGSSLLLSALPQIAQAVDLPIVSDTTWRVYDINGVDLGNAQNVCLNASAPSNCPIGAMPSPTLYGYPSLSGWNPKLSSTSTPQAKLIWAQATWIWAPRTRVDALPLTGLTTPAANASFSFKKEFYICGTPQDSTIWVASDDEANVLLNGTSVLSWSSHTAPGSVNIPAASLYQSPLSNVIEIKVTNGPSPSNCGSDQYNCNPAGVIFGAQFADSLAVEPKCPGDVKVGTSVPLCTPPQTGRFNICTCVAGNAYWLPAGTCMSPPLASCAGEPVSWTVGPATCVANYPGGLSGTSATVTDSSGPTTGTAKISCNNGTVTTTPVSCVNVPPPPASCAGEPVSWTVGPANCDANYPGGPSGASATVTDSSAPTTGIAIISCSNGTVIKEPKSCVMQVGIREKCGDTIGIEFATCPTGTSCRVRRDRYEHRTACREPQVVTTERWCDEDITLPIGGIGEKCGSRTEGATAQCRIGSTCTLRMPGDTYFCEPNVGPPLPLGAFCGKDDCKCASTRCDWSLFGIGSTQTSVCIPPNDTGLPNDICVHDWHCISKKCNNLRRDASGNWIPGQCQ